MFCRIHIPICIVAVLMGSCWIGCPPFLKACNLSSLQLDSVKAVGAEYDIFVTLNIGAGITGSQRGADEGTPDWGFLFYDTTPINISMFPTSFTGDSTGALAFGVNFGPLAQFGSQGSLIYQSSVSDYTCITSTVGCGNVHTQTDHYQFRLSAIPDSIWVIGIEGGGSSTAGCMDLDMKIDFSGFVPGDTTPPIVSCPPPTTVTSCILPDLTGGATITDSQDPNPTVTQSPSPGSLIYGSSVSVMITATDGSGNSSACSFPVTVNIQPLGNSLVASTGGNGLAIACKGGVSGLVSATPVGGCPPYTYLWSNGDTSPTTSGLAAGWQSLTLTDTAGVVRIDSIFLQEPALLQVSRPTNITTCPGNLVTFDITFSGGNSAREYCLRKSGTTTEVCFPENSVGPTSVGPLSTGLYFAAVRDAEGCERRDTFQINQAIPILVNLGPDQNLCEGQQTTLATGGTSGQFLWSTGATTSSITVDTTGMYSVTVTDTNGCAYTDTTEITLFANPTVNLGQDTILCDGETLTLQAGNPGASFQWSTGEDSSAILVMQTGVYILEVTDSVGCIGQDTVAVALANSPVASFFRAPGFQNQSFVFSDNSSGDVSAWWWDFGDGNTSVQQNPTHTYTQPGNYTVCLSTFGPCGLDSICIPYVVTSLHPGSEKPALTLFPNPNRGKMTMQITGEGFEADYLKVVDLRGKLLYQKGLGSGVLEVDLNLETLSAGLYFLTVGGENGEMTKRFEIQP